MKQILFFIYDGTIFEYAITDEHGIVKRATCVNTPSTYVLMQFLLDCAGCVQLISVDDSYKLIAQQLRAKGVSTDKKVPHKILDWGGRELNKTAINIAKICFSDRFNLKFV